MVGVSAIADNQPHLLLLERVFHPDRFTVLRIWTRSISCLVSRILDPIIPSFPGITRFEVIDVDRLSPQLWMRLDLIDHIVDGSGDHVGANPTSS